MSEFVGGCESVPVYVVVARSGESTMIGRESERVEKASIRATSSSANGTKTVTMPWFSIVLTKCGIGSVPRFHALRRARAAAMGSPGNTPGSISPPTNPGRLTWGKANVLLDSVHEFPELLGVRDRLGPLLRCGGAQTPEVRIARLQASLGSTCREELARHIQTLEKELESDLRVAESLRTRTARWQRPTRQADRQGSVSFAGPAGRACRRRSPSNALAMS